jgi:acetoin utilization deacetylase AcuC-like enzyme
MILYDPGKRFGLIEFGIEIPVDHSRQSMTFDALMKDPTLRSMRPRWHIDTLSESAAREDLLRAHSKDYVDKLFSEALEGEIVRTFELIDEKGEYYRYNPKNASLPLVRLFDRILMKVGGTIQCCRTALENGFCFFFGGGMHHAQRDFGNGFCMLNDLVIAVRKLQAENKIESAWIIDLDAHKGDGTAAITQGDATIKTLSIHMAQGWPLDGPKYDRSGSLNPSFIPSDVDIGIGRGEKDLYSKRLEEGLKILEESGLPDFALVVSGADPYEKDELPSAMALRLTLAQMRERDLLVHRFLQEREIPRAYVSAGGYGRSAWEVDAQFLLWVLKKRMG